MQKRYEQHWEVIDRLSRERNRGVEISMDEEGLWRSACNYFKWCDENPIQSSETVNSGNKAGSVIPNEKIRPYTIQGLCLHCGITKEYLNDIRNGRDKTSAYFHVVSTILYIIYTQNVENATVGIFNPIFTAKVLNIGEKEDNTGTGGIKITVVSNLPELSKSENEILEKLELEMKDIEKVDL